MTYEAVLQDDIKPFGRWQIQTFLLFLLPNTISIAALFRFANISPPTVCAGYGKKWSFEHLSNFSTSIANLSGLSDFDSKCQRFSIFRREDLLGNMSSADLIDWTYNQRLLDHEFLSASDVESCGVGEWRYDIKNAVFRKSLVQSFDLVCNRQYFIPLVPSAFCIGSNIGSSLGGALGDSFGRK